MEQILLVMAENAGCFFLGSGIAFTVVLQAATLHRMRKSERQMKRIAEAVKCVSERQGQLETPSRKVKAETEAGIETKAEIETKAGIETKARTETKAETKICGGTETTLLAMENAGVAQGESRKPTGKECAEELLNAVLGEVF